MRTSESKGHSQRYDSSAVLNLKFLYAFAKPHDRQFKFTALARDRGQLMGAHRIDFLAFAHEILSLHDDPAAVSETCDPHDACSSSTTVIGANSTRVVGVDGAHAELPARGVCQRRARQPRRRDGRLRHDDLGGDPVRDCPVGIRQLDLDTICARRLARALGDEPNSSACALAGDQPHIGSVSPTLMPASLRSATSATASIGSSATRIASSRPAKEKAAWPTSTATSCTTPDQGARTTPRSRSASATARAASAALSCASRSTQLQPRHAPRS